MQQLKDRIQREGRVLPGNIIKVDGFLNHRIDTALMSDMADEFAKYFDVKDITMVLTAEASGIALATICAQRYGVPMVFAKKAKRKRRASAGRPPFCGSEGDRRDGRHVGRIGEQCAVGRKDAEQDAGDGQQK